MLLFLHSRHLWTHTFSAVYPDGHFSLCDPVGFGVIGRQLNRAGPAPNSLDGTSIQKRFRAPEFER